VAKLCELAKIIRSKNSKAFILIFDCIFSDQATYMRVKNSGVIDKGLISRLYNTPVSDIMITWFDEGNAIKITMPRPFPQASEQDADQFGGQQYAPLLDIEIP
jgi:hypothetical protein